MAAGSNPAVIFLKDAISNRLLTTAESIQALSGLPMYVRTPTLDLLNELYVIIEILSLIGLNKCACSILQLMCLIAHPT